MEKLADISMFNSLSETKSIHVSNFGGFGNSGKFNIGQLPKHQQEFVLRYTTSLKEDIAQLSEFLPPKTILKIVKDSLYGKPAPQQWSKDQQAKFGTMVYGAINDSAPWMGMPRHYNPNDVW